MLRKLTVLLAVVSAAAVAVLIAPSMAFACNSPSAACVYSQSNTGPDGGHSLGSSGQKALHVSKHLAKTLSHAGKYRAALTHIVRNPDFGHGRSIASVAPGSVVQPSAFSAIFDLGAGPLAVIAVLIGSALLVLAGTGWRGWRRWRGGRLAA